MLSIKEIREEIRKFLESNKIEVQLNITFGTQQMQCAKMKDSSFEDYKNQRNLKQIT
jgi:hypothetical protein